MVVQECASLRADLSRSTRELEQAKRELAEHRAQLAAISEERAVGYHTRREALALCADILTPLIEVPHTHIHATLLAHPSLRAWHTVSAFSSYSPFGSDSHYWGDS